MFANFARRPIAQQLIMATISAFVVVFAALIVVMQQKAESAAIAVSERNLEHEAKLMAGMLDSIYQSVKIRGENEAQFFRKYLGGEPEAGAGMVKTGDVELPVIRLGNEVINGNDRHIKGFRDLTGSDAAFLMVRDNKVYRLATLLKDKDGKPMNGVPLPDGDPVAKALLAGQDYQGLAIRGGKYNFSTVKFLRGADGKPWLAFSVRISLENELKRIREQFGSLVSGKTGYAYIARPTDEKGIGEFVMHPKFQEKQIGELDVPAQTKDILRQVLQQKNGVFRYPFADASGVMRDKIVVAATSAKGSAKASPFSGSFSYNHSLSASNMSASPRGYLPVLRSRSANSTVFTDAATVSGSMPRSDRSRNVSMTRFSAASRFSAATPFNPIEYAEVRISSVKPKPERSSPRPDSIRALRRGASNFLQKPDSSLPSLVSNTSSHRLPACG